MDADGERRAKQKLHLSNVHHVGRKASHVQPRYEFTELERAYLAFLPVGLLDE